MDSIQINSLDRTVILLLGSVSQNSPIRCFVSDTDLNFRNECLSKMGYCRFWFPPPVFSQINLDRMARERYPVDLDGSARPYTGTSISHAVFDEHNIQHRVLFSSSYSFHESDVMMQKQISLRTFPWLLPFARSQHLRRNLIICCCYHIRTILPKLKFQIEWLKPAFL